MIKNVVFDIGRVLIWWDMKLLYREIFNNDEEKVDWFLNNVCTPEWNLSMDAGKTFKQGVAEKQQEFPEYADEIAQFDINWQKAVPGFLDEPVQVLADLQTKGYPVYALTNFSTEKFAECQQRFPFLNSFDGLAVSAHEKLIKPDPRFFNLLCDRYNIKPEESVFIDDNEANIESAQKLGFKTILFKYPDLLRPQLQRLGVDI